jgi:hypothetical protein
VLLLLMRWEALLLAAGFVWIAVDAVSIVSEVAVLLLLVLPGCSCCCWPC